MTDAGAILVVGADGTIGAALARQLRAQGEAVVETTRRPQSIAPGRVPLDLARDPSGWEPPPGVRLAFLCAAVSGLEACCRDPVGSRAVNVEHTARLASALAERGAFAVFPSTSQVFDGTSARRPAADPVCPRGEYGRQKAEAEARLLAMGAAVVRLTKVVRPDMPLLAGWVRALRAGVPIRPLRDLVMAPVSLAFAATALARIGLARRAGIAQVSATRDVTYEAVARRLCARLGADPALVQPTTARQAGLPEASIAAHTSLDSAGLEDLGLSAPDPWDAVDGVQP